MEYYTKKQQEMYGAIQTELTLWKIGRTDCFRFQLHTKHEIENVVIYLTDRINVEDETDWTVVNVIGRIISDLK